VNIPGSAAEKDGEWNNTANNNTNNNSQIKNNQNELG
jgi:hypothetical protein